MAPRFEDNMHQTAEQKNGNAFIDKIMDFPMFSNNRYGNALKFGLANSGNPNNVAVLQLLKGEKYDRALKALQKSSVRKDVKRYEATICQHAGISQDFDPDNQQDHHKIVFSIGMAQKSLDFKDDDVDGILGKQTKNALKKANPGQSQNNSIVKTRLVSEQENNALYDALSDNEKAERADQLTEQTVRTTKKLDLDKTLEFYEKHPQIMEFLNNDPKAKAHHFDGISLDKNNRASSQKAIENIQQWQSKTRGLMPDGEFGRSCVMMFAPQDFEKLFGFPAGEKKYVSFHKKLLNVLTVDGTGKHFGDITGDRGLAFGILHFTHKDKFEDYLRLFYGESTEDVSQKELVLFRKQVLEPAGCVDYEKAHDYFDLKGNDHLWSGNRYFAHLIHTSITTFFFMYHKLYKAVLDIVEEQVSFAERVGISFYQS